MQHITTLAPQRAFRIADATDTAESHTVDGTRACPVCHRRTPSLKEYTFCRWTFVGVGVSLATPTHVACPSCMRKAIGKNSLINVFSANILWPFVVLPWGLVLLGMSFSSGHSCAGGPVGQTEAAVDESGPRVGVLGWILFRDDHGRGVLHPRSCRPRLVPTRLGRSLLDLLTRGS